MELNVLLGQLYLKKDWENAIHTSKFGGIVLEDDYTNGVGTNLAYKI